MSTQDPTLAPPVRPFKRFSSFREGGWLGGAFLAIWILMILGFVAAVVWAKTRDVERPTYFEGYTLDAGPVDGIGAILVTCDPWSNTVIFRSSVGMAAVRLREDETCQGIDGRTDDGK
jgi:hypothetical protein